MKSLKIKFISKQTYFSFIKKGAQSSTLALFETEEILVPKKTVSAADAKAEANQQVSQIFEKKKYY